MFRGIMMIRNIGYIALVFSLSSCFLQPDKISESKPAEEEKIEITIGEKVTPKSVAAKNFLQINNTYSSLTGIKGDYRVEGSETISDRYELMKMQLPSSSNPESLNGFNQIASTSLAFLYCDPFIDQKEELQSLSNEEASKKLIESFIDADFDNEEEHKNLYDNVLAILDDEDSLIDDNNSARKKLKLLKLSCTAVLSSSYVTLL